MLVLVPVVLSNDLRAAPARQSAWNVYVKLADGGYCMHGCKVQYVPQPVSHMFIAGLSDIFNKVAVA